MACWERLRSQHALGYTNIQKTMRYVYSAEEQKRFGEFAEEMKGQKGMDVTVLVKKAIVGVEAGSLEIRIVLAMF